MTEAWSGSTQPNGLFFKFPRRFIDSGIWSGLMNKAQAIYPAVCVHLGANGKAYPGQRTIARYAGTNRNDFKEAIEELQAVGMITVEPHKKSKGGRGLLYRQPQIRSEYFFMYHEVIRCGLWSEMTVSERALYPAMLRHAVFNSDVAEMHNDRYDTEFTTSDGDEFAELYGRRRFSFYGFRVLWIADQVGISKASAYNALKGLERRGLVEKHENGYLVFMTAEVSRSGTTKQVKFSEVHSIVDRIKSKGVCSR